MKVKLDEHIPVPLVRVLEGLGHDVDTVASEGLAGRCCWRALQPLLLRD